MVWSRSGKTVGVAGIRSAPWHYAQAGLRADQISALANFLRSDDRERSTELQNPKAPTPACTPSGITAAIA